MPARPLEAPTHLRSNQLGLAVDRFDETADDLEPPTAKQGGMSNEQALEEYSKRVRTESSSRSHRAGPAGDVPSYAARRRPAATPPPPLADRSPRQPTVTAAPLPAAPTAPAAPAVVRAASQPARPPATPAARAPSPVVEGRSRSSSKSASRSSSKSAPAAVEGKSRSQSQSQSQPAGAQLPPGMGAFDPLQVSVPPELAAPIYSWVRRLALQADLKSADRVLRDALLDTSSSLTCTIVYPGQDGLWCIDGEAEMPKDPSPLIAVAQARRAVIASHTALIPILTSSETVGVIVMTRNPRNPAYHPVEQIAMIALAREAAAIVHHLAIQHMQHQREVAMDKGSLYRGEALEAHRTRGTEGEVTNLSPSWVKRTYPLLVIALLAGAVASILVSVPTYSSGPAVVTYPGTLVTSPIAGTVAELKVKQGTLVRPGTVIAVLDSAQEQIELDNATTEYQNAQYSFLFDQSDDQAKKLLASAAARVEKAQATIASKTIRAREAGVVGELKTKEGKAVTPGGPLALISPEGSNPEVWAFLPGSDRPRLKVGQVLMMKLNGYKKQAERVVITEVRHEAVAAGDTDRYIGESLAVALKLNQQPTTFTIVKARLPMTFKTEKTIRPYFHGMTAKVDVMVQEKPFLATLLPALEKYLPE